MLYLSAIQVGASTPGRAAYAAARAIGGLGRHRPRFRGSATTGEREDGHSLCRRPVQQVLPLHPTRAPVHGGVCGAGFLLRHCSPPWCSAVNRLRPRPGVHFNVLARAHAAYGHQAAYVVGFPPTVRQLDGGHQPRHRHVLALFHRRSSPPMAALVAVGRIHLQHRILDITPGHAVPRGLWW
jgi:hypothetical protein